MGDYVPFTTSPTQWLWHMLAPWFTLSVLFVGFYSRVLRGSILDAMGDDFVRTARAKGLSERRVFIRHVLRMSLLPIISLWGLDVAQVIGGGAILTETVYNLHGVGQLAAEAVGQLRHRHAALNRDAHGDLRRGRGRAGGHPLRGARSKDQALMSDALLSVDDLKVSFATDEGVVQAVDGVSFEVNRGEVVAVVGESGSGKSVTGMTLMGLTRGPNARISGSAKLDGQELLTATNDELRKIRGNDIAMIFQDPISSLNPVYKVGWQIVEQIRTHNRQMSKADAMAKAVELMERVGVPRAEERLRSYPHEFSGGMRQRVMIAMALSCSPKLLIADEPTTALDVTIQAQILDELRQLRDETNAGIILVTHDLAVVADIADRVVVMYCGTRRRTRHAR